MVCCENHSGTVVVASGSVVAIMVFWSLVVVHSDILVVTICGLHRCCTIVLWSVVVASGSVVLLCCGCYLWFIVLW